MEQHFSESDIKKIEKLGLKKKSVKKISSKKIRILKNVLMGIAMLSSLINHGRGGMDVSIIILEYIGWMWIVRASKVDPSIFTYFSSLGVAKKRYILWNCTDYLVHFLNLKSSDHIYRIGLNHKRKKTVICPLDMIRIIYAKSPEQLEKEYQSAVTYPTCLAIVDLYDLQESYYVIKFNPNYDIFAKLDISQGRIYLLAYAGKEIDQGGKILYIFYAPQHEVIISAEWSPTGKYLLVLVSDNTFPSYVESYNHSAFGRKMHILKYDYASLKVKALDGCEKIILGSTQCSHALWINDNSFLIPSGLWGPLLKATIFKKIITTEVIFEKCEEIRQIQNIPNVYKTNYSGCIFTGDGFESVLFWITNCIEGVIILYF